MKLFKSFIIVLGIFICASMPAATHKDAEKTNAALALQCARSGSFILTIITLHQCDQELLLKENIIRKFLNQLCQLLGTQAATINPMIIHTGNTGNDAGFRFMQITKAGDSISGTCLNNRQKLLIYIVTHQPHNVTKALEQCAQEAFEASNAESHCTSIN